MRFTHSILVVAALSLSACTTAPQQPENRWEVKVKKESDNRVWVYKSDGTQQCEKKAGINPKDAAQQVGKAGVVVFNARSGSDGKMRITKCGAPTGKTVELEISEVDIGKAKSMGYSVKTM